MEETTPYETAHKGLFTEDEEPFDRDIRAIHTLIARFERPRHVHDERQAAAALRDMHRALGLRLALDLLDYPGPESSS